MVNILIRNVDEKTRMKWKQKCLNMTFKTGKRYTYADHIKDSLK